jgi:hypothetical protein
MTGETKTQILLINYSFGNSQIVRNRMVKPFEIKDEFKLNVQICQEYWTE